LLLHHIRKSFNKESLWVCDLEDNVECNNNNNNNNNNKTIIMSFNVSTIFLVPYDNYASIPDCEHTEFPGTRYMMLR
jgi:hypothetical protein